MTKQKNVYLFGNGKADGQADMKNTLGGKGANLAEMNLIGVPVPPGFTIITDVCNDFFTIGKEKTIENINDEVRNAMSFVEELMGSGFGDKDNPCLVSV